MATLSFPELRPHETISKQSSPPALYEALKIIFVAVPEGLWLVGGTALAGYYAEHRRSDDLDLFAVDEIAHRSGALAVKSLTRQGAILMGERTTPNFYHADVKFKGHAFTIDVVLDENLHRIGSASRQQDGVWVADLATLFATKAACLVSRCSEKDLFDLDWILSQVRHYTAADLVEAGNKIDGGVCIETLLVVLQGAILRKEACRFLLPDAGVSVEQAYHKIVTLRKKLIQLLLEAERKMNPTDEIQALSQAVKDQKKIK